jgi:hypothetical protein
MNADPGLFDGPTREYRYAGRAHGLHIFERDDRRRELYARRKHGPASWLLRRGGYCFEFCRGE